MAWRISSTIVTWGEKKKNPNSVDQLLPQCFSLYVSASVVSDLVFEDVSILSELQQDVGGCSWRKTNTHTHKYIEAGHIDRLLRSL